MRAFDARRCEPLGITFITVDNSVEDHCEVDTAFEGKARQRSQSWAGYTPYALQAGSNVSPQSPRATCDCDCGKYADRTPRTTFQEDEIFASETWPDTDDEDDYASEFNTSERMLPYSNRAERDDVFADKGIWPVEPSYSQNAAAPPFTTSGNLWHSLGPALGHRTSGGGDFKAATMQAENKLPMLLGHTSAIQAPTAKVQQTNEIGSPSCGAGSIWAPKANNTPLCSMASSPVMPTTYAQQPQAVCVPAGASRMVLNLTSCILPGERQNDKTDAFREIADTRDKTDLLVSAASKEVHEPRLWLETDEGASANLASEGDTTVVVRNLPKDLGQQTFLEELDRTGFAGTYDFCYMPRSFATGLNQGFAFVNFKAALTVDTFTKAWTRTRHFHMGPEMPYLNVCKAAVQGLQANIDKWSAPRLRRIRNPNYLPFVDKTSLGIKQAPGADTPAPNTLSQSPPPAFKVDGNQAGQALKPAGFGLIGSAQPRSTAQPRSVQGKAMNSSPLAPSPVGRVMQGTQEITQSKGANAACAAIARMRSSRGLPIGEARAQAQQSAKRR